MAEASAGDADSDGPAPEAAAGSLTGEYDAELLTLSCSGAYAVPTATSILGPLSYCDVGDTDYDYMRSTMATAS